MGMAIQDALHLKSLLQEMKLQQLAKPFELTVYTDSSSGKALASKLGLTRKSKHVQLRYLFMQDLAASGQLKLSKTPSEKNPEDVLTKCLTASALRKLLPKLGVMTRAADSKDLLSMISFELSACSPECPDSFFIDMMAEEPVRRATCCIQSCFANFAQQQLTTAYPRSCSKLAVFTENFLLEQLLVVFPLRCCFPWCSQLCQRQLCQLQDLWLLSFCNAYCCQDLLGHQLRL